VIAGETKVGQVAWFKGFARERTVGRIQHAKRVPLVAKDIPF
jgi:hypothetical protein